MADMQFPCNGILVVVGNLPGIFPMSTLIYASLSISYFNLKNIFIGNGPALCFNTFGMYFMLCHMLIYILQLLYFLNKYNHVINI